MKTRRFTVGAHACAMDLKKAVITRLRDRNVECDDVGSFSDEDPSYVDHALKVAEGVASGEYTDGVVICWSGVGVAIAANKVPGIRAALCHDVDLVKAVREGNDVNVLALGCRDVSPQLGGQMIDVWLDTDFSHPELRPELDKITKIERDYCK